MALTARKIQQLADKGFPALYEDHSGLWEEMARQAYEYTKGYVVAAGQRVRPDDVIDVLVPALELSDEFRGFLEDKRLRQKYWRLWFGELVLDELWTDLTEQGEDADD